MDTCRLPSGCEPAGSPLPDGPASVPRRALLRDAAGALLFSAAGGFLLLTPAQARAQGVPLKKLTMDEVPVLEAVGETMAVSARELGIAYFVDQQCAVAPQDALLTLRLAGAAPPFIGFYRASLAEITRQSQSQRGVPFQSLTPLDQHAFIDRLRTSALADWKGPPQGLVYAVLRADAVDVVYGTVEGFERLGVPYMPHIPPSERW